MLTTEAVEKQRLEATQQLTTASTAQEKMLKERMMREKLAHEELRQSVERSM